MTPRQATILEFIRDFTAEHHYAPTLREIGKHFGIVSPNGVVCHLVALRTAGRVTWDNGKARTIRVIEQG